jgi:hypothetical protein
VVGYAGLMARLHALQQLGHARRGKRMLAGPASRENWVSAHKHNINRKTFEISKSFYK